MKKALEAQKLLKKVSKKYNSYAIYLRLPPVKGGAAERRRRDCYRVKKIEKDRTQPLSQLR